jgi:exodeoxyribonuclease VII small subunit
MPNTRPQVESLDYEQARDELIEIVAKLEAGSTAIEQSLELWERGEALAAHCQALLDGVRDTVAQRRGGPAEAEVPADMADAGVVGVVVVDTDQEDAK